MSQPTRKLPSRLGKVAGSIDSNPPGTSKFPCRSSKGRLQALLNMPLDVFLEICTHLQPADLLNMARSSKGFRTMFMDRRSRYSWRAARANVFGLPPCPDDLSEPAYASLAFEAFCHNCVKYHGDVYWGWRVRLCRPCFDKSTINVGWVDRWIGEDAAASLHKLREQKHEQRRSFELLPVVWVVSKRPALLKQARPFWYIPDVKRLKDRMVQVSPEDLSKLLDDLEQAATARLEEARQLEEWYNAFLDARAVEDENLREARRQRILDKLKELGWREEIEYFGNDPKALSNGVTSLAELPAAMRAQPMSKTEWKNMKSRMIGFMEECRERMLYQKRHAILVERFKALQSVVKHAVAGHPGLTLSALEVAVCVPGVENLLDATIPASDFDIHDVHRFLESAIPPYLADRDNKAREALAALIRHRCGLDPLCDPFSLGLAVGTIIICPRCNTARALPHALRHQCSSTVPARPEGMSEEYYDVARTTFRGQFAWDPRVYPAHAVDTTARMISLCGFDIKTATAEELDGADVRVKSATRSSGERWVAVMPWRTAALEWHRVILHSSYYDQPSYGRASPEQVSAARPLEPAARNFELSARDACREFRCALCPANVASKASVLTHIRESHNVAEPLEHHWVDEQLTIAISSPVHLVSEELRGKLDGVPCVQWDSNGAGVSCQNLFDKGTATFISADEA